MEKRYRWAVSELVEDAVIEKCKKPEFTGEPWGIRAGESRLGLNPAGQGRGPQPLKGSSILTYSLVTWGRWPNPLTSLSHAFDLRSIGRTLLAPPLWFAIRGELPRRL